ncbi:MAG: response regulator [Deltaproteobacteria bacterium]|nr:response regulator [Candidatus Anaeroferrophillus wilburensis]MBN2888763.1 response regulator [Deltaproteobacteria bacterium]
MRHKYYLQFFIFISICLGLFLFGGASFYRGVMGTIRTNLHQEQFLVAERIKDTIETYLERIGTSIDSVLAIENVGQTDVIDVLNARFQLLQAIYPEISNVAFANTEEEIFFSGKDGRLLPVGIPMEDVYEWQHLKQKFWWQVGESQAAATVTELFQFIPSVDHAVKMPVVLFSKNVVVNGFYAGTILIPFHFDYIIANFLESLPAANERLVALISDRGLVLYSTIGNIQYSKTLPAFSGYQAADQQRFSLIDQEQHDYVSRSLLQQKPFYCRYCLAGEQGDGSALTFESYFAPVTIGGTLWTLMVGTPLPGPYAAGKAIFIPLFFGSLSLIVLIGLVTFWLFRQTHRYWGDITVFKAAIENSGDGLYIADLEGKYRYVNQAYCQMTGYDVAELLGCLVDDLQPDMETDGSQNAAKKAVADGELWSGTVRKRSRDQRIVEVLQSISPVIQNGAIVGYACSQRDISDEMRLKRQLERYSERLEDEVEIKTRALAQSQKMETVGLLASGFAHDFNNLLAGIFGNIQLLELETVNGTEKCQKYVAKLKNISLRASELVRQILDFSRQSKTSSVNTKLSVIIQETVELASHSLPKNISLSFRDASEDSVVKVDKAQIMQVLMNILINARDAIGLRDDGRITITTSTCYMDSFDRRRLNLARDGWYVETRVADNGPGIPAPIIDRIFDPFFTTKEWSDRKGTGIGLSIAYTVVHNYDGTIQASSRKGEEGTTFSILLPCVAGDAHDLADETVTAEVLRLDGKTVLVIDDEVDIRETVRGLLEHHGASVVTAEDGRQGLEFLDGHRPDVILLDLVMPTMSGERFLEEMSSGSHDIPVVVMTGLAKDGYQLVHGYPLVKNVLKKPFRFNDLVSALSFMA